MTDWDASEVVRLRKELAKMRRRNTIAQKAYFDAGTPELFRKAMETYHAVQVLSGQILSLTQPS